MENYKGFTEKLGSPLDKESIKIMDEQFETVPLNFFQMFSDGFKLRAIIMIEVLCSGDKKKTAEYLMKMELMEKLKSTPYVEEFNSLMQELVATLIAKKGSPFSFS